MKKLVSNTLYTLVGLIVIVAAGCILGQCFDYQQVISPSPDQQDQPDNTDTNNPPEPATTGSVTTGTQASTGDQDIEVDSGETIADADEFDPDNYDDTEINELLDMLEEMLDINE